MKILILVNINNVNGFTNKVKKDFRPNFGIAAICKKET